MKWATLTISLVTLMILTQALITYGGDVDKRDWVDKDGNPLKHAPGSVYETFTALKKEILESAPEKKKSRRRLRAG